MSRSEQVLLQGSSALGGAKHVDTSCHGVHEMVSKGLDPMIHIMGHISQRQTRNNSGRCFRKVNMIGDNDPKNKIGHR